ncbi:MAG: hypothetical protein WDA42_00915 [Candidatus Bathyarchaeia archaeon]
MGSVSDMNDLDRFSRSKEGQELLDELRNSLLGKKITNVHFLNEISRIDILFEFEDGATETFAITGFDVDSIREEFWEAIEQVREKEDST